MPIAFAAFSLTNWGGGGKLILRFTPQSRSYFPQPLACPWLLIDSMVGGKLKTVGGKFKAELTFYYLYTKMAKLCYFF